MFGIVKDAVKIIVGTGLGYSCKDWKPAETMPALEKAAWLRIFL